MGDLSPGTLPAVKPADERLDSWKEIAAYLRRDVTTVQRWEKREGMPVHRHLHDKMGSVYALRSELDAWTRSRRPAVAPEAAEAVEAPALVTTQPAPPARRRWGLWLTAAAAFLVISLILWQVQKRFG